MSKFSKYIFLPILFLLSLSTLHAQRQRTPDPQKLRQQELIRQLEDTLTTQGRKYASAGIVRVKSLTPEPGQKHVRIITNETLSFLPLRPDNVDTLYSITRAVLSEDYPDYSVSISSDGLELSNLIPGIYRTSGKSPYARFKVNAPAYPLVSQLSAVNRTTMGLQNRHIALWQSHGRYYNQTREQWMWQRPVLFQTVEDLFTQAFVLPFLVPMLENAGANVLLPRERDTQLNEVIIDNDRNRDDSEFMTTTQGWKKGVLSGFAHFAAEYKERENPFRLGSYLQHNTTTNRAAATEAHWIPDIPEKGEYAVYIAYKSLPNSSRDARYTVTHAGGSTEFSVNQSMGGGTWIYLGSFEFDKGKNQEMGVKLSNFSNEQGKVVTADAVKIGGGMGNISRKRSDQKVRTTVGRGKNRRTVTRTRTYTNYSTSGYPRFTEGARYWLQWAGVPDSVYSRTEYSNDYSDDFQSRGFWVNYLAGGSPVLPGKEGLQIPVDLAFAMHSDAGVNNNDSIIGTLAIYTVLNSDKKTYYANGITRRNAREMTDIIQTQIVDDIRATFRADWNRRGLWNKNYSESRVGEVPTMLLEILSHQNFADMRYGHDPRFRFIVSRAIYKGMLRYIALTNDYEYRVQPLPVHSFSSRFSGKNEVELSWEPTIDKLEPTANAESYIIYTRIDDGGFDNGQLVHQNSHRLNIEPGKIYSFKVKAVNRGGTSFPSETLSVYKDPGNKPTVLIVNGFTRISGPQSFTEGSSYAGFNTTLDAGVPYISDINFTGKQTVFNRNNKYIDDARPGHGTSETDFENHEIAGNSFDYPFIHGKAIRNAGFSFVSSSKAAVEKGEVKLTDYDFVDLILGKEKQVVNALDSTQFEFKTFNRELRRAIQDFSREGGNLIVSGSNLVSDLFLGSGSTNFDQHFIEETLKIKWSSQKYNNIAGMDLTAVGLSQFSDDRISFYASPNLKSYFVEAPDVIEANHPEAVQLGKYLGNGKSAGIIYKESYGVCAIGFPFETITDEAARNRLMTGILNYFNEKK